MQRKALFACMVLFVFVLAACSSSTSAPAPAPAGNTGGGASTASATPKPTVAVPAGIPLMPNATDIDITESSISFVIKSDLQKAIDFYEKELVAKGWKEDEKPSIIATFGRMNFSRPDVQLSMILNYSEALNQVVVRMTIFYLNVFQSTPTPAR